MNNFRKWAGMDFQDVAKKGLKYGGRSFSSFL